MKTLVPKPPRLALLSSLPVLLALAACGGGGSSAGGSTPSAVVAGTAAIGAAAVNFTVSVLDSAGAAACANTPVTTDAQGAYRCELTAQAQAPLAIVTTDPAGLVSPMISLLPDRPAAGASTVANVSPLTTAIAAQLDSNKDPFALYKDPTRLASLNTADLAAVTGKLVTQLTPVLSALGVDASSFNPLTTPFVGGSGTGADALLDQVRVTFDGGVPHLSNVLNATAPSVPVADASTSTPAPVSTSALTSPFSVSELDFAKTEMQKCFALPAATRAPNPDTARRLLQGVAPDCENFVASAGDAPNVDIDFLNSGYSPEAYFYDLMTSASMDGAVFNRPELLRYIVRSDGRDEAVLNIKYSDRDGYPGNLILTAKKFAGSRPAGQSQWWLIGNQRVLDAFITTDVRRRDQTITDFTDFPNAGAGRFDTGLRLSVRRGSVATPNNPNGGVWYVRVRGPALPPAGLVLAELPSVAAGDLMGLLRADGVIPAGAQQVAGAGASSTFRLQRTQGLDGAAARTLRANPGAGDPLPDSPNTAHPSMYGAAPSSTWLLDVSGVVSWAEYSFEAFDGSSSTVPVHTWTSRLVTPLVPATQAVDLPWHGRGASTTQFLTLGAPAVGTVTVDWVINPLAERVQTVWAQSYLNVSSSSGTTISNEVFSDFVNVPSGANSALVTAAGTGAQWQSLVAPTTTSRIVTLLYRTLDGSRKQEQRFFN